MESTKTSIPPVTQPSFYKVSDIQRLLGIGRNAAYALVATKDFPTIHVGNKIIVPSDLFNEWVRRQATQKKGAL